MGVVTRALVTAPLRGVLAVSECAASLNEARQEIGGASGNSSSICRASTCAPKNARIVNSSIVRGSPVAGIGFGIGIDRVTLAVQAANQLAALSPAAVIIALGEPALRHATGLARTLRARQIDVEVLSPERKIKALLGRASKIGARFAVIVGEDELKRGVVQLRDLLLSKQSEVAATELAHIVGAALAS